MTTNVASTSRRNYATSVYRNVTRCARENTTCEMFELFNLADFVATFGDGTEIILMFIKEETFIQLQRI